MRLADVRAGSLGRPLRITGDSALNRGPDEWLPTFADPVRAQSAIDRFANNAFDLVIEGESYRSRLKPTLARTA